MNKQKKTTTSGKLIKAACASYGYVYVFVQVSSKYEMAYGTTDTFVASNSSGLCTKVMFL